MNSWYTAMVVSFMGMAKASATRIPGRFPATSRLISPVLAATGSRLPATIPIRKFSLSISELPLSCRMRSWTLSQGRSAICARREAPKASA